MIIWKGVESHSLREETCKRESEREVDQWSDSDTKVRFSVTVTIENKNIEVQRIRDKTHSCQVSDSNGRELVEDEYPIF